MIQPSDEGKTPEEIEAEERARIAEENFGAFAALTVLGVKYLIHQAHEDEIPADENELDDPDWEEENGQIMTM